MFFTILIVFSPFSCFPGKKSWESLGRHCTPNPNLVTSPHPCNSRNIVHGPLTMIQYNDVRECAQWSPRQFPIYSHKELKRNLEWICQEFQRTCSTTFVDVSMTNCGKGDPWSSKNIFHWLLTKTWWRSIQVLTQRAPGAFSIDVALSLSEDLIKGLGSGSNRNLFHALSFSTDSIQKCKWIGPGGPNSTVHYVNEIWSNSHMLQ